MCNAVLLVLSRISFVPFESKPLKIRERGLDELRFAARSVDVLDAHDDLAAGFARVEPRDRWNLLDRDVMAWHRMALDERTFLLSLQEIRRILEPGAAVLAAARRTPTQLAALEAARVTTVRSPAELGVAIAKVMKGSAPKKAKVVVARPKAKAKAKIKAKVAPKKAKKKPVKKVKKT